MAFQISQTLDSSPLKVFTALHDSELVKTWMPGLQSVRYLSDNPRQPGAQFEYVIRQVGKKITMRGELLKFEPPKFLAVRLKSGQFSFDVEYRLADNRLGQNRRRESSVLTYDFRFTEDSPLPRLLIPAFEVFMKKLAQAQLAELKKFCDQQIQEGLGFA